MLKYLHAINSLGIHLPEKQSQPLKMLNLFLSIVIMYVNSTSTGGIQSRAVCSGSLTFIEQILQGVISLAQCTDGDPHAQKWLGSTLFRPDNVTLLLLTTHYISAKEVWVFLMGLGLVCESVWPSLWNEPSYLWNEPSWWSACWSISLSIQVCGSNYCIYLRYSNRIIQTPSFCQKKKKKRKRYSKILCMYPKIKI